MPREQLLIEVTEKGTIRVRRNLRKVGQEAKKSTPAVNQLRSALVTLGAVQGLRAGIRTLASFGQEMSTVAAVTNATGPEFARLTARAKELGATTRFTAGEAAAAMTNLARAGFDTEETMEAVGDTLLLAQAGALDLSTAASITASTLRGFRLNVDQTARVTDVLAAAANNSNTTVEQLGEGMKFVAPVAAGLGISIEETSAAMMALSDAGLQSTMAGTGLRRTLSELESPSAKTTRLLDAMSIKVEEVRPSMVGLSEALKRLKIAGIDTGLALEIFGDRGGPAFEVLSSSIPKVTAATDKLRTMRGETKRIAEIMDDNLNGALLRVRSAIEAVVLSFGKVRGGALQKMFEGLATSIRFFAQNAELAQGVLAGLATVIVISLLPALKSLVVFVAGTNPFGAWLYVLGLLMAAIITFREEIVAAFKEILRFVAWTFDQLIAAANGVAAALPVVFKKLPSAIGDVILKMVNGVIFLIEEMINLIIKAINRLVDHMMYIVNRLSADIRRLSRGRIDLGTLFIRSIKDIQIERVQSKLDGALGDLGRSAGEAYLKGFREAVGPAQRLVDDLLGEGEKLAGPRISPESLAKAQAALGVAAGEGAQPLRPGDLASGFYKEVPAAFESTQEFLENINGELKEFEKGHTKAFSTGQFITDEFNAGLEDTVRNLADISGAVSSMLVGAFDSASDALAEFALSGFQNVEDLRQAFSDLFRQLAKDILQLVIRIALLKALEVGLGGGGLGSILGGATGAIGGKQVGGPVVRGVPVRTGERGEELFVPPSNGNIIPAGRFQTQPDINVTSIIVKDEDEALAALDTPAGDLKLLNFVSRKRGTIRRML